MPIKLFLKNLKSGLSFVSKKLHFWVSWGNKRTAVLYRNVRVRMPNAFVCKGTSWYKRSFKSVLREWPRSHQVQQLSSNGFLVPCVWKRNKHSPSKVGLLFCHITMSIFWVLARPLFVFFFQITFLDFVWILFLFCNPADVKFVGGMCVCFYRKFCFQNFDFKC